MREGVWALLLLIVVSSTVPLKSEDLPHGVLEIAHTLRHNRDLLKNLPAYTCLETISRHQQEPKQRKPHALDIVQVDVGVGEGQEIYSWPGEQAFSSSELGRLVGHGFLETGFFHTFASNLFVSDAAVIRLFGEEILQGRDAIRFMYNIPWLASNWKVDWLGARGVVGESGEFWVDKNSLTLLRFDADADNFPPNVPLKTLTVRIDYETLAIGGKTVLIPSSAEIVAVELKGTVHRDAIAFSQCHIFEAESKIASSPEILTKAVERYEAHREALPGGLDISIALESAIRGDVVRIGDAVTARLNKPVKLSAELTVPRGALVKGRVREFRNLEDPPDTRQVGIGFDEIDWPGHVGTFFAEAVSLQPIAGLTTIISRGTTRTTNSLNGLLTNSSSEKIRPAEMPGVAMFFLSGAHVIPKGFQMTWRTRKTRPQQ